MMKSRSFRYFVEQELGKLPRFIIYAVLELTLMAILFIDGALAYLANIFAELFELSPPCLLCTRVNYLFDRTDHDLHYNNTMCEDHKKEISSFAYCHVHRKLSDLRTMCDGCLLAFGPENNAIASATNDNNKDIDSLFNDELRSRLRLPGQLKDDPSMQGHTGPEKPSSSICSCCGEPMKAKSSYPKPGVANVPAPSPRTAFNPWKNEEAKTAELPPTKPVELKLPRSITATTTSADEDLSNQVKEDVKPVPSTVVIPESEDLTEDFTRTPSFAKAGNKFFNNVLGDSGTASPRFGRTPRKSIGDRLDLISSDLFESAGANEPEDSIVNRLKKQMKLDRKSLIDLSRELDEERSASAVAANNAMAMITRLQADKATVQMEALQYQRMMDEQAEYDQEALSALHDLLEKREYEMRDMQDELEAYKEKYGVLGDVIKKNDHFDKAQSFSSFTERSDHEEDGDDGHVSPDESVFDIETDVDPDPSMAYYDDHAYAVYENDQLPKEENDDMEHEMGENEGNINDISNPNNVDGKNHSGMVEESVEADISKLEATESEAGEGS